MAAPPALQPTAHGLAGPVVAVVMDGIGCGRGDAGDAVAAAHTPNLDRYAALPLSGRLTAHGRAVGMPGDDDMGNSEVGHNALGAGRIFDQGATLVAAAVRSQAIFAAPVWQRMVGRVQHHGATLHLLGLLSDGNVHSHIEHLLALVARADAEGVRRLRVHVLLDGRDVARTSALGYVDRLEAALAAVGAPPGRDYAIASGGGRMQLTMDRYGADWAMVERGWQCHVQGRGPGCASARAAIEAGYAAAPGIGDQDLPGFVVHAGGRAVGPMVDGDAVIAFNFRGDRMLEIVRAFEDDAFSFFDRGRRPDVLFAGMTLYDGDTHRPRHYLVEPPAIEGTLGELLAAAGAPQLAVAETQKFGHVTYFWNGNRSGAFDPQRERYVEVPSPPAPFDRCPQMAAEGIVEATLRELGARPTRLARLNFANGDMVGHTGNFAATQRAVEVVDRCLGTLEAAVLGAGGALVVTADHGNADEMAERDPRSGAPRREPSGALVPKTSHSLNPVPFHVLLPPARAADFVWRPPPRPGLGNVAATLAVLTGFAPPAGFLPPLVVPRGA